MYPSTPHRPSVALLLSAAVALAVSQVPARAAGWQDAPYRSGSLLNGDTSQVRFGITLKSQADAGSDAEALEEREARGESALSFYGSLDQPVSREAPQPGLETAAARRSNILGIAWQHRFDARDQLAVSAEHGENLSQNLFSQDTADSRATVSWTRQWGTQVQPSLTGSVFLGDEFARDESYRQLGRRYFGFSVGGQMRLFRTHTPYLSYQLRRSYYETDLSTRPVGALAEDASLMVRSDDRSLLTAGWRWQVQPNVSLQAEASYGLNADGQDLYNPERSRLFFGTRFDFR